MRRILAIALLLVLSSLVAGLRASATPAWSIDYAGNHSPTFIFDPVCGDVGGTYFSFILGNKLYVGHQGTGANLQRYDRPGWTQIAYPGTDIYTFSATFVPSWSTTKVLVAGGKVGTQQIYSYDGTTWTSLHSPVGAYHLWLEAQQTTCAGNVYDLVGADYNGHFYAYQIAGDLLYDLGLQFTASTAFSVQGLATGGYAYFYYYNDSAMGAKRVDTSCNVTASSVPDKYPVGPPSVSSDGLIFVGNRTTSVFSSQDWNASTNIIGQWTGADTNCPTGGGVGSTITGSLLHFFVSAQTRTPSTQAKVFTTYSGVGETLAEDLGSAFSETGKPIGIFAASKGADVGLFVVMQAGSVNSVYCYGDCSEPSATHPTGQVIGGE